MRALRVLGLAEATGSGTVNSLVCEDAVTGEQFSVPCDDRLRAGARGDLSRFGQLEIEMESQLRPREIQARIRAGATVQQVASLAGTATSRVERFAYPVLLERASVAEKAKKARPAIDGITAGISVVDTVAATLAARGHDGDIKWDAFKDDDGWVLTLTWSAGRSDNCAQWLYHPGPDGGTLSARDEAAAEIVDPALRILRPLRPVRQTAVAPIATVGAALLDPTIPTERTTEITPARPTDHRMDRSGDRSTPRPGEPGARAAHPAGSKLPAALSAPAARPATTFGDRPAGRSRGFGQPVDRIVEDTVTDERSGVLPVISRREAARTGTDSALPSSARPTPSAASAASSPAGSSLAPSSPNPSARSSSTTTSSTATSSATTSSTASPSVASPSTASPSAASPSAAHSGAAKTGRKGQRPPMPSWEDVLLGTRSSGH